MLRTAGRVASTALAIAFIALAARGSGARPRIVAGEARAQSATTVAIAGFAYDPAVVQASAGSTVTWTNADAAPHTVTADGGAFGSEVLATGGVFSVTLDAPGTYAYRCLLHPGMTGTVVVTP
jgi:plastocyanin